jgi:hypothetical protein
MSSEGFQALDAHEQVTKGTAYGPDYAACQHVNPEIRPSYAGFLLNRDKKTAARKGPSRCLCL